MKTPIYLCLLIYLIGCNSSTPKTGAQIILDPGRQDSVFMYLSALTNKDYLEDKKNDSLSFLVLPVEASCPACRDKTVDSVLKYKERLSTDQIIIISASKGKKTMAHYFLERGGELPVKPNIFLDSTNLAYNYNLFKDNPTIYYTANSKAYKQVFTKPITIKQDLKEFFSE